MDHKKHLKRLNVSIGIGLLLIVVLLVNGYSAFSAYIFGQTTYGEVIEYDVDRYRPVSFSASQREVERHEILIEYQIEELRHWLVVNSHVLSASGIVNKGDKLLVAYSSGQPALGYVISYGLYSPLASILVPFIVLIFLVIPPQWIYHYRKAQGN